MIQQQLTGLLIFMIITLGKAEFGTLPPRPTTGTVYTIIIIIIIIMLLLFFSTLLKYCYYNN